MSSDPVGLPSHLQIAGLSIPLHEPSGVLEDLDALFEEFDRRTAGFKADRRNPHLCHAGCSHCCKSGAVFAVTLAESLRLATAVQGMPKDLRLMIQTDASRLLDRQQESFAGPGDMPDVPGWRDESAFSARVSRFNSRGPACPLLVGDLCSLYIDRPLLCRAYGFPVDAFAVRGGGAIVFRSLCVLYEGKELADYVRAEELKARLTLISQRLGGGQDWGRFTSIEAILAQPIHSDWGESPNVSS